MSRTQPNAAPSSDAPHGQTPTQIAAHMKFVAAFAAWLAARAAVADPGGDDADEVRSKLHGAEREAEIRLIQTPSPAGWALVQKMEFVEHLVTLDTEGGPPAYPLVC